MHLGDVPQRYEPGRVVPEGRMEAAVEKTLFRPERLEPAPGEIEAGGPRPQVIEVDPDAVGTHGEGPVKVDLVAVGTNQAAAFAEAAIEPRPRLGVLPL